jgi:hypothetical protein
MLLILNYINISLILLNYKDQQSLQINVYFYMNFK